MGKRLVSQLRGKGTPRYRSPRHRFEKNVVYPKLNDREEPTAGQVLELVHDAARSTPLMKVLLEDFTKITLIAPEGIAKGDWIHVGAADKPGLGDVLAVADLPEGTEVCNLERTPGDGGSFVRASGAFASIVSHASDATYLKLPSKQVIRVRNTCRATVGRAAGSGRKDKPFAHAGQRYYKAKAKNKLYPVVKGAAKNALDHPHGGGRNPHGGGGTSVSRNAPPGRKAGMIAPKRTGKRKR